MKKLKHNTVKVRDTDTKRFNAIPALKGDGETPHIGPNGNWWVGEIDTGVLAGTPTILCGSQIMTEGESELPTGMVYVTCEGDEIPDVYLGKIAYGTEDITSEALPTGTLYLTYELTINEFTVVLRDADSDEIITTLSLKSSCKSASLRIVHDHVIVLSSEDGEKAYHDMGVGYDEIRFSQSVLSPGESEVSVSYVIPPIEEQAVYVCPADAYKNYPFTFEDLNKGLEIDETAMCKLNGDSGVRKTLVDRAIAGAAMANIPSGSGISPYYLVHKVEDEDALDMASRLDYYFAYTDTHIYLGIREQSRREVDRSNYFIRIGLDMDDYSKAYVLPIGASEYGTNNGSFLSSAKTSVITATDPDFTNNFYWKYCHCKQVSNGGNSTLCSGHTYTAIIRYGIEKEGFLNAWNEAFPSNKIESFPSRIYISVSLGQYSRGSLKVTPFYGTFANAEQIAAYANNCPIVPDIIVMNEEV